MTINFEDKVINYVLGKDLYDSCSNFTEVYEKINDYILDREVQANKEIRISYDIIIKCVLEEDNSITVYANKF